MTTEQMLELKAAQYRSRQQGRAVLDSAIRALLDELALLRITAADDSTDDQRVQAFNQWREKYGGGR